MSISSVLPFARGKTMCDGEVTPTTSIFDEVCGNIFQVKDTVNGTGQPVFLRAVRNTIGGNITVTRALYSFDADSLDYGCEIDALAGAGDVCKPLDDAYTVGQTILENDICYVVEEGPCSILTGASSVSLNAQDAVSSEASGQLSDAVAAAGEFVVGTIDQDTEAENTAVVVHVKGGIANASA